MVDTTATLETNYDSMWECRTFLMTPDLIMFQLYFFEVLYSSNLIAGLLFWCYDKKPKLYYLH